MKKPRGAGLFVRSADPAVVTVYQGHSQQVVLHGGGLRAVTSAQVVRNGVPVVGVAASLGTGAGIRTSSDTDMIITVVAQPNGAPGEDYTLRLRSRETSYDVPATAFTVKVWVMQAPRITAFWINGRETATKDPQLSLHHQAQYPVTHYRVCATWQPRACLEQARWQTYKGTPIPFTLEPLCNAYKVFLQLKNEAGSSLPPAQAGIQFYRVEYNENPVKGSTAYERARAGGFAFHVRPQDDNAVGSIDTSWDGALRLILGKRNVALGAKCDFELFAGRLLHPDYAYYGHDGRFEGPALSGGRVLRQPQRSSRDMRMVVRLWLEPAAHSTTYLMRELYMEGPCHVDSAVAAWDR